MWENFEVSVTLFGFIALMITLLPVVLHASPAVRHVSWSLMSNSIKILCGVLIGMTLSGLVVWTLGGPESNKLLLVHVSLYVFWYIFLQAALLHHINYWRNHHFQENSYAALAVPGKTLSVIDPDATDDMMPDDVREKFHKDMDTFFLELEFRTPLLSIACSSSGMFVWAALQSRLVRISPNHMTIVSALSMVFACFGASEIMVSCAQKLRDYITGRDGSVDKLERAWNRCVDACERNLVAYQTSFLFVQCLRLAIVGRLPLPNGVDPPCFEASEKDISILFSVSCVFIALLLLAEALAPHSGNSDSVLARLTGIVTASWGNTIAFCWLYSATWLCKLVMGPAIIGLLFQVIVSTMIGLYIIAIVVDDRGGAMKKHETIEKELMQLITPLSVWIGFTWRELFKSSLMTMTGYIHYLPPPLEQGIFAVVVVSAVLPTWRKYVLTQEHVLRKAMTEATTCSNPSCKNVFMADARYCRMCGMPRQGAATNGLYGAAAKSALNSAADKANGLGQPLVENRENWLQVETFFDCFASQDNDEEYAYARPECEAARTSPYSSRNFHLLHDS